MDALETIERVWPSAGRALELLRGARVNLTGSTYPSQTQRSKRSAERALDDSDQVHGRFFNPPTAPSESSTRPNGLGNYIYPTAHVYSHTHTPTQSTHPISPLGPSSPANYRWQSDNFHQHPSFNHNSNAPLSTSVLPQLYSTGFGDDRVQIPNGRQQPQTEQNVHTQAQRYPQYWNDHSTFSQLGQTYGSMHESGSGPTMNSQDPMYLLDQYGIYSKLLSSSSGSLDIF